MCCTTAQKYDNHSRLNSQHDRVDPHDHLDAHETFHFDIEKDIHMSSNDYEANGYGQSLDLLIILH